MDTCPYCGGENRDGANFCGWCGEKLREPPPEIVVLIPSEEERHTPMPVATLHIPQWMADILNDD